ncbi:MAG TPA: O-antigen ligase family protein [Thermodesulfobacteriaceae bacterium]|nr:O-antigen ligase family protein [Thermodesulfobacteriaceae bacterium]
MSRTDLQTWSARLDSCCLYLGSSLPVAVITGNAAFETVLALVAAAWIARSILARESLLPVMKHSLVTPWLAWYSAIILSVLFNIPGGKGWIHDLAYVRYIIFVMAMFDVSRRRPVAGHLLAGLACAVVFAAINTVMAYSTGHDIIGRPLTRYTQRLKEAERIAGFSAYAAPFFLGWSLLGRTPDRLARAGIFSTGLTACIQLIQGHTRTAWIACAAALYFYLIYACRKRRAVLAGLAVFFVACVYLGIHLFQTGNFGQPYSWYHRIYIWKICWFVWLDDPVFGAGISSFRDVFREISMTGIVPDVQELTALNVDLSDAYHAHNLFLMLLCTTGLIGLGSFLWLLFNSIRMIFQDVQGWRTGLISWPVVLFVCGLTGYNIFHGWYQAVFTFFIVLIGTSPRETRTFVQGQGI